MNKNHGQLSLELNKVKDENLDLINKNRKVALSKQETEEDLVELNEKY